MARTGVLLTAFGGPHEIGEIAQFMRSITGADPTDAMLAEAHRKYLTIGGFSPLPAMGERIAAQLERSLNGLEPGVTDDDDGGTLGIWGGSMASVRTQEGVRIPVEVGMLHSEPSIAQAVARLADRGAKQIVHISLSPFEAAATTGAYREAIGRALQSHQGIRLIESASYHLSDGYVGLYADNLSEALHDVDILANKAIVVFTAHSLPSCRHRSRSVVRHPTEGDGGGGRGRRGAWRSERLRRARGHRRVRRPGCHRTVAARVPEQGAAWWRVDRPRPGRRGRLCGGRRLRRRRRVPDRVRRRPHGDPLRSRRGSRGPSALGRQGVGARSGAQRRREDDRGSGGGGPEGPLTSRSLSAGASLGPAALLERGRA